MDTLSSVVAGNVRAELGRQDKTRAWLSEQLDVQQMWVSRRLSGQTPISLDEVALFARALGVDVAVLLPVQASA